MHIEKTNFKRNNVNSCVFPTDGIQKYMYTHSGKC